MLQSIVLLLCVLLAVALLLIVAAAHLMAESILHPPRMTDGKAVYVLKRLSPADLGLQFQEERIEVRDAARPTTSPIEIAGWWIPSAAASERCVVLLHGYADAKVGSIAWAPVWHSLGYNILAIDLRAHGESGGCDSTAGFFERHDVDQVLDRLRHSRPEQTRELVLFGLSMGAAVALATAAMRQDLEAVVIDSPFADYRSAVGKHLDRLGLPTGITSKVAIWLAQVNSRADFAAVQPAKLIPGVPCPLMMIRGEQEDFLSPTESTALDRAMQNRPPGFHDCMWIVPGAAHLGALGVNADAYARRLGDFLNGARPPT
jgi:pimeloyl-ACP methyl ester carboxylesterase